MHIYPSEALDEIPAGGPNPLVDNPIGTGPYRLQAWERGSQIVLERNEDYWGEAPSLATVVFQWQTEAAQRRHPARERRRPRASTTWAPRTSTRSRSNPDLQLLERDPLNVAYLGMNVDMAPFDNEQVRQAVALAIDRDRLVENFYPARFGGGDPVPAPGDPRLRRRVHRLRARPGRGKEPADPGRVPRTGSTSR